MNKKEEKTDWVFVAAVIASIISVVGLGIVVVLGEMSKTETVEEVEEVEECPVCNEYPMFEAVMDNLDALCAAREKK